MRIVNKPRAPIEFSKLAAGDVFHIGKGGASRMKLSNAMRENVFDLTNNSLTQCAADEQVLQLDAELMIKEW